MAWLSWRFFACPDSSTFHVTIVENAVESDLKRAAWLFPASGLGPGRRPLAWGIVETGINLLKLFQ
jgi:hypothetical protein